MVPSLHLSPIPVLLSSALLALPSIPYLVSGCAFVLQLGLPLGSPFSAMARNVIRVAERSCFEILED